MVAEGGGPTVDEAADTLYAGPVEDFTARRTELAKSARQHGERDVAAAIAALRKPTAAAAIVNQAVQHDTATVERLRDIGDRLRRAQRDLDPALLRDLSGERRRLVDQVTTDALARAGGSPGAGIRDEVRSTIDAAVADPDVTHRLGRLTRAEHFSGFGLTADAPDLRVLPGGKAAKRGRPTADPHGKGSTGSAQATGAQSEPHTAPRGPSAAERSEQRRRHRELTRAQDSFDSAEQELTGAQDEERAARDHVRTLSSQLSELQHQLSEAKVAVERAHRDARGARSRRQVARSALDRAARRVEQAES